MITLPALKAGITQRVAVPLFASVLTVVTLCSPARAESPGITQMAVTQQQAMDARAAVTAATDPVTGAIKLESEPMQCAISCEQRASLERAACAGYLNAEQRTAQGLEHPTPDCNPKRQAKYSACMAQCGFKVPALLRTVRDSEDRSPPPSPAIGSPEELATRQGGR